jgi:hypothetical protein
MFLEAFPSRSDQSGVMGRTTVLQVLLDSDERQFSETGSLDIAGQDEHMRGAVFLTGDHMLHAWSSVYRLWNFTANCVRSWSFQGPDEIPRSAEVRVVLSMRFCG